VYDLEDYPPSKNKQNEFKVSREVVGVDVNNKPPEFVGGFIPKGETYILSTETFEAILTGSDPEGEDTSV